MEKIFLYKFVVFVDVKYFVHDTWVKLQQISKSKKTRKWVGWVNPQLGICGVLFLCVFFVHFSRVGGWVQSVQSKFFSGFLNIFSNLTRFLSSQRVKESNDQCDGLIS